MSNYQKIKDFAFNRLQSLQLNKGVIEENDIDIELASIKILTSSSMEIVQALFGVALIELLDEDFARIHRELEMLFNVKMEQGILIQGEEQQKRDTTWWTGNIQQESENFYWNRYRAYLKKTLPDEIVKTIDIDTDIVMNNLENPKIDSFSRYGMVVGHVQSGKTANYASLVCKAADAGFKFIVVIAGGINNLRNQTQERINEAFIGIDKGQQIGAGVGNAPLYKLPISLTTVEKDFNTQDARRNSQATNFETNTTPVLLVIKKNTTTLQNVITWLEDQYKNKILNHAMLMIDDESDYASINTKVEEDPTKINEKLRKLLSLFSKNCYVAYTATPFANIFINHEAKHEKYGDDLFPKDFIYALDAPTNYFGARKIFLDSNNKHLVVIPVNDYLNTIPSKHKIDFVPIALPASLLDAIRAFIINIGIRALRGQQEKHNSMLIHATRFTDVHKKFSLLVENYIEQIKVDVTSYGMLKNGEFQSIVLRELRDTFMYRYKDIEFGWEAVKQSLSQTTRTIVIREVHQKKSVPLEYRKDRATNVIVIGGTSVSRGFTLEGLSISYFLRNTIFYDTLMQMGRWFGYRNDYEDICKVYLSDDMIENFTQIIEATEDLFRDFKLMAEANKTPLDFGLAIKQHPDSFLQITAKNKLKNTKTFTHSMNLNGHLKETVRFSKDIKIHQKNLIVIKELLSKLPKITNNKYIWSDVNRIVVIDFLKAFITFDSEGIKDLMPIRHIEKYAETINTNWDIVLYSGTSDLINLENGISIQSELRNVYKDKIDSWEIGQRKISSGTPELAVFSKEDVAQINKMSFKEAGEKTSFIRSKLNKPILMLHILKTDFNQSLAAFGICFPNNGLDKTQTIEYTINTVLIKELEEMESDD